MKQDVVEAINDLAKSGRITPEDVVTEAEDVNSPLHHLFEWDDGEAAHRYRLDQARHLIRSVKVHIKVDNRVIKSVAYVRDPDAEAREQGYVSIFKIPTKSDLAREVMHSELGRVISSLTRARAIADSLGLLEDIEDLLERVTLIRAKAEAPVQTNKKRRRGEPAHA